MQKKPVGWRNERRRHSLAARGIKTVNRRATVSRHDRTKPLYHGFIAENISLNEWKKKWIASGRYKETRFTDSAIAIGWVDWFCTDRALIAKSRKLAPMTSVMVSILGDEYSEDHCVSFANHQNIGGEQRDSISFSDRYSGDMDLVAEVHRDGHVELFTREDDLSEPVISGSPEEIYEYLSQHKRA